IIPSASPLGSPPRSPALASSPGTKSARVGRSVSTWERAAVVTANGRNLPALINSSDVGTLSNITCTWPLIRSVSAGAPPRYGTCTMSMPVIILNSSPDMDGRAGAGGRHVELARIGFRVGDEFGNGLGRHRRVHHDHVGKADETRDRRDVAHEIVVELFIKRRVNRVRRSDKEERI